tara:strand:+ start:512 stop:649 length:138 start_codon:yes stop_codon:yes gene_type:complete
MYKKFKKNRRILLKFILMSPLFMKFNYIFKKKYKLDNGWFLSNKD